MSMAWLRLYGTYVKMFFRSRREYRASFFAGMAANFYCYFITYATYWVITQKFTTIGGWAFPELTVLYSLNLLTYAISGTLFWYTIYFLEGFVTTGGLDRYLVRPGGVIPQLMCQGFGSTFLGQIVVSLAFLLTQLIRIGGTLTWYRILYLVIALISGVLLQAAGVVATGALSFWILRSTPVGSIAYYDVRSFANYPLTIYPRLVKIVLTYILPWAFINYYPSLILLNRLQTRGDLILGLAVPLVGGAAFAGAMLLFRKGLKRYASAGN
jgi:ABC-2 type transport system permease protein